MSWDSFEAPAVKDQTYDLEGPEMVIPGRGCRLILRACAAPSNRDEDLKNKVRAAADLLLKAGLEGFSSEPQEGLHPLKSYRGTLPPVYITGADAGEVTTALARAVLKAPAPVVAGLKALGVRALMEWSE